MSIRKILARFAATFLVAGTLFAVSQNISLSVPKSLGYQSATISSVGFSAGRLSAGSFVTVDLIDENQIDVPIDARFRVIEIGQNVCVHSATQWFLTSLTHRFAAAEKCAG